MSKSKATVTISGGGKSVTLDADAFARIAKSGDLRSTSRSSASR